MIKVWLLRITGGYSYHLYTAPRWQTTPALTMSRVLGALLKIILRTICSIRERTMRITRHHTHTTIYFPDQLASSGADLIQLGLICFNSTKATVISLLQPCFGCHVMPTLLILIFAFIASGSPPPFFPLNSSPYFSTNPESGVLHPSNTSSLVSEWLDGESAQCDAVFVFANVSVQGEKRDKLLKPSVGGLGVIMPDKQTPIWFCVPQSSL